jgi:predicted  nucleic acid-binding Zn-ribbon protein
VSVEERILNIAEGPNWSDSRELRAIALEVRKREDRIKQLEDRIRHLESALRRIADQDYRGNRSTESQIAEKALKP